MQHLEPVLTESIQQYERILDFLQKMGHEMGTADPVALQNFSISLNELQARAMQLDQILLPQLNRKPLETESIQSLIAKRELLLKEVVVLNERITAKASGVKSLIAYEMRKLRNGLSALSGYRQPQYNQGRITDCTS